MNFAILKERADKFYEIAKECYKKGYFDLAAFNIEQAVQLYIKSVLYKLVGDFEKTHDLFELLNDYKIISGKTQEVDELIKNHKQIINELNIAYITSRYLPSKFFKEQLEDMFKFLEELLKIL
ncbi:MAG: HEPN domain-containing protein [Endomicrobia bacterium]|nr:HEPN domain-containing protein [Endomicrobiia bacterium]